MFHHRELRARIRGGSEVEYDKERQPEMEGLREWEVEKPSLAMCLVRWL